MRKFYIFLPFKAILFLSLTAIVLLFSLSPTENRSVPLDSYKPLQMSDAFWEEAPVEFRNQFIRRLPPPNYDPQHVKGYTEDDWQTIIDITWGDGLPTEDKVDIWEGFWNDIDEKFACFHNLDPTIWDTIYDRYTSEIAAGVSRGRFSAILSQASLVLREAHTKARNNDVANTALLPGVPLLICNGWGNNDHFGAALTPLQDSSLLVYKAMESHPLNIVPGDIVLGYDDIPWKTLYRQLFDEELPIGNRLWGSSPSAFEHSWLMGAGMNWHLFDTIDIIQYTTGDTVHLGTDALAGQTMVLWGTEQLPAAGVPMPDYYSDQLVSWGIIEGTTIGYIYGIGWWYNAEAEWLNAVDSLMHHHTTTGLIVDFRMNFGGNMWMAYPGLGLLFNQNTNTIGFAGRCDPNDRPSMCNIGSPGNYRITATPGSYYDKPIAVLVGPGAVSSGDQIALAMMHHPMAKAFGKPTNGAFNSPTPGTIPYSFYFNYAEYDAYLASIPGITCLTHTEFPGGPEYSHMPYEEVWLTQQGVIDGSDDVVEAAIAWIMNADPDGDGAINEHDNCPDFANPDQEDDDNDQVGDSCDNCLTIANTDQVDNDDDGHGNLCDNCPDTPNSDQIDTDEDLIGNACDNCPDVANPDQLDSDSNGVGDLCQYFCGDVNNDNQLNVGDAVFLINYVFKGGPGPDPVCEGDANGDDQTNVADAVYMINYVFKGGPGPVEPCCP
jgi:hypothetical protein